MIFLLYIQSCMFNVYDLLDPSFFSPATIPFDRMQIHFIPIFIFFPLRNFYGFSSPEPTSDFWISAYFPSPEEAGYDPYPLGSSRWPLPVTPRLAGPNRAACRAGDRAASLASYTCLLKFLSSQGNKVRECIAWSCLLAISYVSSPFKKYYIPF